MTAANGSSLPPVVKLEIFIPASHLDALSAALHQAGAGQIGNYDHCKSIMQVKGTWRPLESARPYLGETGQVCSADELKVEVNCPRESVAAVLQAVRQVHPYEEPVINILPLLNHLF